jgi:hypothetical protein
MKTLLILLVVCGPVCAADMGSPIPTPNVEPVPIPTPPPTPKPVEPQPKMEYRLIGGKLFYVPSDSPWSTPTTPYCPDGRCPLPNR